MFTFLCTWIMRRDAFFIYVRTKRKSLRCTAISFVCKLYWPMNNLLPYKRLNVLTLIFFFKHSSCSLLFYYYHIKMFYGDANVAWPHKHKKVVLMSSIKVV